MFGLFKKKSELEKLGDLYQKLLSESHSLSHRDRAAADRKAAEAEEVAKKIDVLRAAGKTGG
jgi:hypothetical protein